MTIELRRLCLDNLLHLAGRWLDRQPQPPRILEVPRYYRDAAGHRAAVKPLDMDSNASLALALAYKMTREEKYARAAQQILCAWALTCSEARGLDASLTLTSHGLRFLEACRYLYDYDWNSGVFYPWVQVVYRGAATSLLCHPNNPGSWGWCGLVLADSLLYTGIDRHLRPFEKHLLGAIDSDTGRLWREDRRTNSGIWYWSFALEALTRTCWEFKTVMGVDLLPRLTKSCDLLYSYCLAPQSWPYRLSGGPYGKLWRLLFPCADQLETPVPGGWPAGLLDTLCLRILDRPMWHSYLDPVRPLVNGYVYQFSTLKWCFNLPI